MIRTVPVLVLFQLACLFSAQVFADEDQILTREQQIAEKLALTAEADEIVNLQAAGDRFVGIYKRAKTGEPKGVVILIHGLGAHPDWPDVISPLRTQLPGLGWSTLSIQMPILPLKEPVADYGSTLKDAENRIHEAVEYLHAWEIEQIILLGYSFGAAQAAAYLASSRSEKVTAFVSVSILAQKYLKPGLDIFKLLGGINIPILDIYGDEDLPDVRSESDDRRLAASKNGNQDFKQIELKQAGANYAGSEDALAELIQYWLQQTL